MPYNPYPYQPMMRHDFVGTPLNQSPHVQAVDSFARWFASSFPDAYKKVMNRNPSLLDAEKVVSSGALAPNGKTGLSGLGDFAPVSDWGKTLTDAISAVVQGKNQNDLIKLNIDRAERGLPPIDSSAVAPGVQVGLSSDTQRLAMFGIGALGIIGVVLALKGKR